MKIAIIHDYLISKGGGERVVLTLAKYFRAPIYTTTYLPEQTYPEFRKLEIYENPLKTYPIPGIMQLEAIFKFRNIDLSQYDILISSGNWAKHIGIRKKNHPQIHYEHTPVRVFYDLYENTKKSLSFIQREIFKVLVWYVRRLDQEVVKKIDEIITNSQNTRKRIKKFYSRDAKVIYPPVNIKKFKYKSCGNYFLSIQRIQPEKRIEIQLEIFRKLPKEKLLIVGSPSETFYIPYFRRIKRIAPKNVEFVGSVSDKQLIELYANCKAVIQTAIDEDFGIIPVESMASGKPCLAVNEGGFRETIIHGKTGLLIDRPYVKNYIKIIKNFSKYNNFNPEECIKRAKLFSEEIFIKQIMKLIKKRI